METDLNKIGKVQVFSDSQVQCLIYQVLCGLKVCFLSNDLMFRSMTAEADPEGARGT